MRLMVLAISNKFRLFFGILLALFLSQATLQAQITASTASYNSTTVYTTGSQDNIFVFCDEANMGLGKLKIVSPDGAPGWDFTWTKWNSATNSYGGAYPIENGQESTLDDLDNGLYRVSIEKAGETTQVHQAWVINHLKNTNQPSFIKTKMDCVGVHFTSSYVATKYQYFDFPSTNVLEIETTLIFSFKRKGEELQRVPFPDYDGSEKSFIDDEAFENDAEYEITVIDECGFEYTSDPITSKTYVVDPTFTFTPETGEAPLDVDFQIENENNSATYEWFLYKDVVRVDGPVIPQDSLLKEVVVGKDDMYSYEHPGEYIVKVIATSTDDESCVYVSDLKTVTVEGSIFEVPNVFTPNGDGANDEFKVKLYSVKSYSVKIFNRWGRLVYEFQESDVSPGAADKKSSKGWNGKINGKLAAPGTYFYVIEAEGREEEGKRYTERGALTLLHNK